MSLQKNAILGLMAETSIHAGAGHSVGGIDLPIQREAHNRWPCIFGSAVKGALRTKAEDVYCKYENNSDGRRVLVCDPRLYAVFGPDTGKASDHAGALLVSDARLVLLPVRSLTGYFKWVTCPAALNRLRRDAERLDVTGFDAIRVGKLQQSSTDIGAALAPGAPGTVYLEEYRFETQPLPDSEAIIKALATLSDRHDFADALGKQLMVVDDDLFTYLCTHATPVNAHVRLESETKTVAKGMLWYEETLPPETVMYVGLSAQDDRRVLKKASDDAETPVKYGAEDILRSGTKQIIGPAGYLQLGGNETVGMGWFRVVVVADPDAKSALTQTTEEVQ